MARPNYFFIHGEVVHWLKPLPADEVGASNKRRRVGCTNIRADCHNPPWEVIEETELGDYPKEDFCEELGCKEHLKPFIGTTNEVKLPGGGT